jgi:CheY-like chemotaxis protein
LLLVEDIEINTKVLINMLAPTKINVATAKNGKEALSMFRLDEGYDIIFMDLQMPVMDGYEATRKIRALKTPKAKNVPIIAISADAFDADVIKVKERGMNEHCAKPVEMEQLLSILKKYLVER